MAIILPDNAHFQFPAPSWACASKTLRFQNVSLALQVLLNNTNNSRSSLRGTLCRHRVFIFSFWCFLSLFAKVPAFSKFYLLFGFVLFSRRDGNEATANNTCTYLDPGCVLSLVLQSTAGCTHSRVCSCQLGTLALDRTGCASPAGSPCWRCDPACLAAQGYRGGPADLRRGVGGRNNTT